MIGFLLAIIAGSKSSIPKARCLFNKRKLGKGGRVEKHYACVLPGTH